MSGKDEIGVETPVRSPLWMVTREPLLNDFVNYLTDHLSQLRGRPDGEHDIVFSRQRLREVRQAFSAMILRGEQNLHQLSELFGRKFFTSYQLNSLVVGEIDLTHERFVLSQGLSPSALYSTSDLDLGTRQLAKLRFIDNGVWSSASLVANFVEYQPTEPNPMRIQKLISRIKAEEEIWNKVVDEIFDLDAMVRRDKQMSHLSQFVKDVFGLKIVVGLPSDVVPMYRAMFETQWDAETLEALGVEPKPECMRLEHLETKNYLSEEGRKVSGWSAMKTVVRWGGRTFEIQIQPLRNYFSEQEHLTQESHAGFKAKREKLRDEIAATMPLFGFYQALLRWLFLGDTQAENAPKYPGVRLLVVE